MRVQTVSYKPNTCGLTGLNDRRLYKFSEINVPSDAGSISARTEYTTPKWIICTIAVASNMFLGVEKGLEFGSG